MKNGVGYYIVEKSFRGNVGGGETTNFFKRVNDHPVIMFLLELVIRAF